MRRITGMATLLGAGVLLLAACSTDTTAPVPIAGQVRTASAVADQDFFGVADVSIEQAIHLDDFPCFLGPAGLATDSHFVLTPSGNATMTCKGQTAVGPPETIVLNDVGCFTPAGLATDGHFVWTKSGQASLLCHVQANG